MGYRVQRIPDGKAWRLLLETYPDGKTKTDHIKIEDWPPGFKKGLTLEQAKALAKEYNAKDRILRQQIRIHAIQNQLDAEEQVDCAYLPADLVEQFQNQVLVNKFGEENYRRKLCAWRAAKRIIREIKMDPSDWFLQPEPIYRYFKKHTFSVDYCLRILKMMNLWGHIYCRKFGTAWTKIDPPSGEFRRAIEDAFFDAKPSGFKSNILRAEDLSDLRQTMLEAHYNWTYLSFWFGLRPEEVDLLQGRAGQDAHWFIDESEKGKALIVYQPKLRKLRKRDRYKRIPILYKEQELGPKIIKSREFKRPSLMTVKRHYPEGATLYAGRHGFASHHMEKQGHHIHIASRWLGHQKLETTERYYRDRQIIHFTEPTIADDFSVYRTKRASLHR
jgi:integrase